MALLGGAGAQRRRLLAGAQVAWLGRGRRRGARFSTAGGASICFALDRPLRRYDRGSIAYTVGAALLACLLGVAVYTFYYSGVTWLMAPKFYKEAPLTPYLYTQWMFDMAPTFIGWAGVRYAVLYSDRLAQQELLLTKSQLLTSDAQNQMLRYQLNPHFLFNTLSAVATLAAEGDAERAEMTVLNLCDFLRMSLKYAPDDKILIRDEIALENAYFAIQRVRFEERLDVDIVVDPTVEECLVPNLILQPLVENAIKHGVGRTIGRVRVSLSVTAENGSVRFAVSDNGGGDAEGVQIVSTGLGLANVRNRLNLLYGERARFTAGHVEPRGFEVVVEIPAERAPARAALIRRA